MFSLAPRWRIIEGLFFQRREDRGLLSYPRMEVAEESHSAMVFLK
jgi:hypothetical protein